MYRSCSYRKEFIPSSYLQEAAYRNQFHPPSGCGHALNRAKDCRTKRIRWRDRSHRTYFPPSLWRAVASRILRFKRDIWVVYLTSFKISGINNCFVFCNSPFWSAFSTRFLIFSTLRRQMVERRPKVSIAFQSIPHPVSWRSAVTIFLLGAITPSFSRKPLTRFMVEMTFPEAFSSEYANGVLWKTEAIWFSGEYWTFFVRMICKVIMILHWNDFRMNSSEYRSSCNMSCPVPDRIYSILGFCISIDDDCLRSR